MNLHDFLAPNAAPIPFTVEGIDEQLHCKLLTCEEAASLSLDGEEAKSPGSGFRFAARLLALALVDAEGKPRTTEESWRHVTVNQQKGLGKLIDKIREVNGLTGAEEVKELGNASGATPASDSSSSSA